MKALAVAAALAVATAEGCGGSGGGRLSKSAYESKLQSEGKTLSTGFGDVARALQNRDLKTLAAKIGPLQKRIDQAGTDIGKLKPPQDAVADNQKIADTLHRFAGILGRLKAAAQTGDSAAVLKAAGEIQKAGTDGQKASTDLEKKGYKIGVFANTGG